MLSNISGVDYGVFALSLLVPLFVAVYYACVRRQDTNVSFFMGNRNVGAVPMAFSLAVTYISAGTITGESSFLVCKLTANSFVSFISYF